METLPGQSWCLLWLDHSGGQSREHITAWLTGITLTLYDHQTAFWAGGWGGYQRNYLPNTDFIAGLLNDLYVASYSVSVLEKTPMNMTDNVFACCHFESGCS